jgi:peptidoglycan/xylan/chitin deacetylase (PgdA/CDA1 family)
MLLRSHEPAIVMYHRVATVARDPWELCVSPANFREQVRQMRRHRRILPLGDLVALVRERRLPPRAVALTFDDGYRDNLVSAAPVLAEFGAPATLFLATGPMRDQRGYWWDVLTAMVLDAPPIKAQLRIGSEQVTIALGLPEPHDDPAIPWGAWQPPRTARQALYVSLWSRIRPLPPEEIDLAMAELGRLLPVEVRHEDGPMTAQEVGKLLASSPVSLGCHTVDHPDLPAMPPEGVREQLASGKAEVEALSGREARGFAYPYGLHDRRVADQVGAAGFAYACTTRAGSLREPDMLSLPRVQARDRWSIEWLYRRSTANGGTESQ